MKSKRKFIPFVEVDVEGEQMSFWCPFCLRHHCHGTGGEPLRKGGFLNYGHRAAHCQNPDSPFKETGYYLKAKPRTRIGIPRGKEQPMNNEKLRRAADNILAHEKERVRGAAKAELGAWEEEPERRMELFVLRKILTDRKNSVIEAENRIGNDGE